MGGGKICILLQDPIEDWKLGWNFTTGERISSPGDLTIYRPDVALLSYNTSNTELEAGSDVNATEFIQPRQPYPISFVGTKAASAHEPNIDRTYSPFLVGPLANLAFNNLICSSSKGETLQTPSQPQLLLEAKAVAPANTIFAPKNILVEYAPITFYSLPFGVLPGSFTQFFVR